MEEHSGDNKGVSIFAKKEKTKILQNGTKYIVMTFSDSVISLLLAGLMLLGVSVFFCVGISRYNWNTANAGVKHQSINRIV